jgi:hypothetical protein
MLPLGRIGIRAERGENRAARFTRDEQRMPMSLWTIAQAPLMFGGDLPSTDDSTLSLISNDEVLAVDQHSAGAGEKYLAVFNVGDAGPIDIRVEWASGHWHDSRWIYDAGQCARVGDVPGRGSPKLKAPDGYPGPCTQRVGGGRGLAARMLSVLTSIYHFKTCLSSTIQNNLGVSSGRN